MEFKNLKDLFTYFKDEQTCRDYLALQRWNGKPVCPYCKHEKAYIIEGGKRYKCSNKECHKKFSVTVGTHFENSNIPLSKWFPAIYLCSAHKKGISSLQLSRDLGVTQKTAWFMLHRIRAILTERAPQMLEGVVQVDESYIGGKNINRHADKKIKHSQGRSGKDKVPVVGLYENNGQVKTEVVKSTDSKTLNAIVQENISKDAVIVTDAYIGYNDVEKTHVHTTVNHDEGEYVNAFHFHTNGIENFWSMLKRGITGIYHSTSKKHLHRYCDEFGYRYNTRGIKDAERFTMVLKQTDGRLTYKQLIAK